MVSAAQVVESYLDGEGDRMTSETVVMRLLAEHSLCANDQAVYYSLAASHNKTNSLGFLLVWLGY